MKTRFYLALVVAVWAITSCTQDVTMETLQNNVRTLTAEIDNGSRSAVTDGGTFSWSDGDAISVWNGSEFVIYNYVNGTGYQFTVNPEVTNPGTPTDYAFYPAGEHSVDGPKVNLPETYTSNESTNAIMMAEVDNSGTLTFKHLGGLMRFVIKNVPASEVNLEAGEQELDVEGSKTVVVNTEGVTDADAVLNVNYTPEENNSTLIISDGSQDSATPADSKATVNVNTDNNTTVNTLTVNAPTLTVALNSGTYENVTAKTAANTLILKSGVNVKTLVVKGGNVIIKNDVTVSGITRDENAGKIYVLYEEDVTLPSISDNDIIPLKINTDGEVLVSNLDELKKAIGCPATIKLTKDIQDVDEAILIDSDVTIDGGNHTITSTATRAINVNYAGEVAIKNLTIATTHKTERAINVIQKAAKLTLDNVKAEGFKYTINVAASSDGSNIIINGGKFSGYAAMNLTGNNTTVSAENTEFYGVNDAAYSESNGFAVISIGDGTTDETTQNVSVTIIGCKLMATSDNGNQQGILQISETSNAKVVIDAELSLYKEYVFHSDETSTYEESFRSGYQEKLKAQGYDVSGAGNELVTITKVAE